jgi:hypothetical protein
MLPDPRNYASKLAKTEDLPGFGPIFMDLRFAAKSAFLAAAGTTTLSPATIREFENSEAVLIIVMAS